MKKYQIIYADPPWKYRESWGNGSNEHTYSTLSFEEIKKLPIKNIVADEAHLYLWVTNPFIKEGLELCKEWGFDYKTLITWVKTYRDGTPEMGMGYYFRSCTEQIIFATRKNMKIKDKTTKNMFMSVNPRYDKKLHSVKPLLYNWIVEKSGDLLRIELFARQKTEGWDAWGNEIDSDIELIPNKL
jgi:N6-adenosine-specific RNA methylase IME4